MRKIQKFYLFWKRAIDIFGSLLGIIVCSIFFWWWVCIAQKVSSKGPILFQQKRVGRNGKEFTLYKFRSMRIDVNHEMTSEFADTDSMTTKFGKFLRASSIDETAQLLNIIKGDMSFIGPRPLIDKHEDHITIELRKQNGAIQLKPGISGYAQIHGRTAVSPEKKGEMDGIYFKRFGFWLDFKIFVYTFLRLFGVAKGR